MVEGNDVLVPPEQALEVRDDLGDAIPKIDDGPWPAFPADLTSIALALATQARGTILIFEKMFENRLFFVDKLVAMGARITLCDPHRAIVSGPSRLHGERVESPDIRAGMAMLIAALCADGTSEIGNIVQIDRGYERIDERLRELGARIERVAVEPRPRLVQAARVPARHRSSGHDMTHPIPPGTRDILPDEMRELRALSLALVEAFERFGYGEVATPTIEYEEVLARGDERGAPVAYRFFDESGELLAMRSDMTIPIARLVANRYAGAEPPFRLCYLGPRLPGGPAAARARCASSRRPGVELVGAPAPEGTAEVVEVLAAALDAAGLRRAVIGLGDADLYRQLLDGARRRRARRGRGSSSAWRRTTTSGSRPRSRALEPRPSASARCCSRLPMLRGGPEVLDAGARARRRGDRARRPARLAATFDALRERGVADRVSLDLGLLRDLGYYTGRDPRGLRPGARPHPRRRRALRRADGPLRPAAARGRLLALPRAPARRPGGGGADRRGGGRSEPAPRAIRSAPRRTARCSSRCRAARCSTARSTCSTGSASTPPSCAATRARWSSSPASCAW